MWEHCRWYTLQVWVSVLFCCVVFAQVSCDLTIYSNDVMHLYSGFCLTCMFPSKEICDNV